MMEDMELMCFQLISCSGTARSCYVLAMEEAKTGNFERVEELMQEGEEAFAEGHKVHAGLIQREAAGENTQVGLLLVHSEDQMMSAEIIKIMAKEIIELHKNK